LAELGKILILAGDGVGPEVMREARRLLDWLDRKRGVRFDLQDDLVGGASSDAGGTPLSAETRSLARGADAMAARH